MNFENSEKKKSALRRVVVFVMILLAAALRIAPHPWNFTPIGAMALFAGAMVQDRRVGFVVPVLALVAGDVFIGFHKLMPFVYLSFLISVAIGRILRERRTAPRIAGATFLGALQFYLITNFAVWELLGSFPLTKAGLAACYVAGIPFFWNTLAGDALYTSFLFGGFALAEYLVPSLQQKSYARTL